MNFNHIIMIFLKNFGNILFHKYPDLLLNELI